MYEAWKPGEVAPATVTVPVNMVDATESSQLRATLTGHVGAVTAVVFPPDGKTLASWGQDGGRNGVVKLWDTGEWKVRVSLSEPAGLSPQLAFTPDGRTLLVARFANDQGELRGGVQLFDVATGKAGGALERTPSRGVQQMALAPDGKTLVVHELYKDGAKGFRQGVSLWDLASGKPLRELSEGSDLGRVSFSPDGKTLAIAGNNSRLWDVATGKEMARLGGKAWARQVVFSPNGKSLAFDQGDRVVLWDVAAGKERASMAVPPRRFPSSLAFAPDGKTVAVALGIGGRNVELGEALLCDASTGKERLHLRGHIGGVLALAFSPDGRTLVTGGSDARIKLWDVGH